MTLFNQRCSSCNSEDCKIHGTYKTLHNGTRTLHRCTVCGTVFSETKNTIMAGIRKPVSLIVQVLKVRSEGLGFNAACRSYEITKNTLLNWERKLSGLAEILLLYSLMHSFLEQVIEGDELYTKVGKNVPVEDCEGWTIVLMERASRFIWDLSCGKKDRTLFFHSIQLLRVVIERTKDLALITDGERRYGNILFEICSEVVRTGARGRPPKVLREGLKLRLKNKGSQRSKNKRKKYESPHREHPDTVQNIDDKDIHANHVEAYNASLRRRNSAYRRKTNTYAKTVTGLQRTLDLQWIAHNFIRRHFTTKMVPAVALGILQERLSWEQILMVVKPA